MERMGNYRLSLTEREFRPLVEQPVSAAHARGGFGMHRSGGIGALSMPDFPTLHA
jgi:hypothetical protein